MKVILKVSKLTDREKMMVNEDLPSRSQDRVLPQLE